MLLMFGDNKPVARKPLVFACAIRELCFAMMGLYNIEYIQCWGLLKEYTHLFYVQRSDWFHCYLNVGTLTNIWPKMLAVPLKVLKGIRIPSHCWPLGEPQLVSTHTLRALECEHTHFYNKNEIHDTNLQHELAKASPSLYTRALRQHAWTSLPSLFPAKPSGSKQISTATLYRE